MVKILYFKKSTTVITYKSFEGYINCFIFNIVSMKRYILRNHPERLIETIRLPL